MNLPLIMRKKEYPFVYFPEEAFYKEQVVALVCQSYEYEIEGGALVVQPQTLSIRDVYSITLGKIGRIVHLYEDHEDMFYDGRLNDFIRDLAVEYNNDLIKVLEEFMRRSAFGIALTSDMSKAFEQDIKKVFETENMFYLDTKVPYDSLYFFHKEGELAPFCDENIDKVFRNLPIVRVW